MEKALKDIKIKNKTIFLDIDGVVLADHEKIVSLEAVALVGRINKDNQLYLLSNNTNRQRVRAIAKQLNTDLIESHYRKPNPRAIEGIKIDHPLVVIGDKWWTDGRFARNIKADFIKAKRIKTKNDRWYIKLSYWLDNLIWSWQ